MTATVRIPPTLRNEVGGERQVPAAGGTVRAVLEDLAERYPGLRSQLFDDGEIAPFVNVYLGGEDVRTLDGLDTPVSAGSTMILLPAMAGGSPDASDARGSRPAEPGSAARSRRWTSLRRAVGAEHSPTLLRSPATRRDAGSTGC